jgi:hypothetical protein
VVSIIVLKKGKKQRPDAGPDARPNAMLLHHCVWSWLPPARPVIPKTGLKDL